MSNQKYTIGIDFGTLSGRAVIVNVATGEEVSTAVMDYSHAVMDEYLPDNKTKLEPDWALQYPADYIEVFNYVVPEAIKKAGIQTEDIIAIGIDFTECSMLPIDENGTPLCFYDELKSNPHSYVKLWKHHAAQDEANQLTDIAKQRGEKFLQRYGGKISSEWMIPKIWQILNEDPEIYDKADRFMELSDWIVLKLTGKEKRNTCTAGLKALWHKRDGYPSKDFFKALDPRLENVVEDKLNKDIYDLGTIAGELVLEFANSTGLKKGTPVAVAVGDAQTAVPAVGITEPGKMMMIMGTSTCHMILDKEEKIIPGMCGVVEDGIIPGYYGYEAGQACVGDHFSWFVKNCVPQSYMKEAEEKGVNIFRLLKGKASKLKVGESGLIALDWWNGNRSVLVDADLTGLIIGCNLLTKPEEIYRALMEATAFGTKIIIDAFVDNGIQINELYAAGGIAEKDELMMQIYADVTNMEIRIAASPQTPALGAAIYAAAAAGKENGGYDDIADAAKVMGKVKEKYYSPIPENVEMYSKLFNEYKILHDYFGKGENNVMKNLKEIKKKVISN